MKVVAANEVPVSGVTVVFEVQSGGGTLAGSTPTTDAAGIAKVEAWTLGLTAGPNLVTATVSGLAPVSFTATGIAGPPASMTKERGDNQSAIVGTAVTVPPAVEVRDANANPVPGVTVSFAVTAGNGTLNGSTPTTDARGVAALGRWTLGAVPGSNTVAANVGAQAAIFTATGTSPPPPGQRAMQDRPDEVLGNQIHIMYVLPSDNSDRQLDLNGTLGNTTGSFQAWLLGLTGGRPLRVDTYQGMLDITFFRLSRSDAVIKSYGLFVRDTVENELAQAAFDSPTKVYAVYYDGGSNHACGGAAWPPLLPGRVAALYLRGTPPGAIPCIANPFATSGNAAPGFLEFAMLHEVLHAIGFVSTNAPHHVLAGHVSDDPRDLMYAGPQPWRPSLLDVGRDDYFATSLPIGVLNLADSPFLRPTISSSIVTTSNPGWDLILTLCGPNAGVRCLEASPLPGSSAHTRR